MKDDFDRINSALARLYPSSDPIFERVEQVTDFYHSFDFRYGDAREIWETRSTAIVGRCGNCGFKWVAVLLPMPRKQLNSTLERSGFCVRCCETENIYFMQDMRHKKANRRSPKKVVSQRSNTPNFPTFKHVASR